MQKIRLDSRRHVSSLSIAVLRSFRVIYGSVRQHFREVQRACGVSGSQLWILHEINQTQGVGVTQLAARLSIHQSTCSQLVEKLARAGYVKKTPQSADRRRVELGISTRGRRALRRAPGPAEGVLAEAIADLSKAQLRDLHRGLRQVIAALDMKDEEAAGKHLADL